MTQTRYRLINGEDYEYLEQGKAYEPDYKAADTGPLIIDLVKAFPNDWKKIRHRPNRKRITAAMYNQVVAERDALRTQLTAAEEALNTERKPADTPYALIIAILLALMAIAWYIAIA